MKLGKYSFGVGDRFGMQAKAQLEAMIDAKQAGIEIVPVWNKSHREHMIIGTEPASVRAKADAAVKELGWNLEYYVDADHIGLKNVGLFLEASDFFTLDIADFIGECAAEKDIAGFLYKYEKYSGVLELDQIEDGLYIGKDDIEAAARKYLLAIQEAGKIYRNIELVKGVGNFVTEISMDETDEPQRPVEMLFILAAIAEEQIPAETIAPKFTGRFNKGVDYVGDVRQFAEEFEANLAVIRFAVENFGLPLNLKLSIHSGSDKFSIYGPIKSALKKFDAGLHIKTAGTTWLEEIGGLAVAGKDALAIAKQIYAESLGRFDELCAPYERVINIEKDKLPTAEEVSGWSDEDFYAAVCHDEKCRKYDANIRQLLHVGYKVAAEMGEKYLGAVKKYEDVIGRNVKNNIFERHIKPLFID